jgi:hypothetical protein
MINLESFEALPWATPAIAWGATLIIGLAIGLAAHLHGTVFRQYAFYFGPQQDDIKRGSACRMVIGGSSALTFSLAFVYYARSAYFASYTLSVSSYGSSGDNRGFAWIVGGSLIGNIIVYLAGVLWAYLMHDDDPNYVELRDNLERMRAESLYLKKQMEAKRARDVEQLLAANKIRVEEVKRAATMIQVQPGLRWPRELFARIEAKDALVLAALTTYRQALVQKIANTKKIKFVACCDDPHAERQPLATSDFQSKRLKLKYLEA